MRGHWITVFQLLLLIAVFVLWDVLTRTEILPPFFFGEVCEAALGDFFHQRQLTPSQRHPVRE